MRYILSIDAETNGLHGSAFAIGAVFAECNDDYTGVKTIEAFVEMCTISKREVLDEWVAHNVLPVLEKNERYKKRHASKSKLLKSFASLYEAAKALAGQSLETIVFCGYPVETNLFKDLHDSGILGDFDHPLPLIDIATIFSYLDFKDPVSMEKNYEDITGKRFESVRAHDPLYDAQTQLDVYVELKRVFHESQTNL